MWRDTAGGTRASLRQMFDDERATEAALTFLRDTKASLAPPEEGEDENENEEGEDGGPGLP